MCIVKIQLLDAMPADIVKLEECHPPREAIFQARFNHIPTHQASGDDENAESENSNFHTPIQIATRPKVYRRKRVKCSYQTTPHTMTVLHVPDHFKLKQKTTRRRSCLYNCRKQNGAAVQKKNGSEPFQEWMCAGGEKKIHPINPRFKPFSPTQVNLAELAKLY